MGFVCRGRVGGGGVGGGKGAGNGDFEVELCEEGFGEIGVFVAAFEDDAVKFVLSDCHWPVGFLFTAACETVEELGVEHWDPAGLAGGSPVLEDKENAGRVVNAGVAVVGEEDTSELGTFG